MAVQAGVWKEDESGDLHLLAWEGAVNLQRRFCIRISEFLGHEPEDNPQVETLFLLS
jgi:hypothetical protein